MLNGDGNENGKSNEQKKKTTTTKTTTTLHVQHAFCTFLCRCFVRFQRKAIIKIALSQ